MIEMKKLAIPGSRRCEFYVYVSRNSRIPAVFQFHGAHGRRVTRIPGRWLDPNLSKALKEGAVWQRTRGAHEQSVRILREVNGRVGDRYLVEGLESGRQWLVSQSTLLDAYRPKP